MRHTHTLYNEKTNPKLWKIKDRQKYPVCSRRSYGLAGRVKDILRKCPELQFYTDDSLDYVENIDRLLASDPHLHDEEPTEEK